MGRHQLGPHVVGQRVVVRRLLPGERGPSGGPAMTDVLGECLAWGGGQVVLRRSDQSTVQIPLAEIVSGKPVPPRRSTRLRISPDQAQRRAQAMWPDLVTRPAGGWLLRSSAAAAARRANSVLAMTPAAIADPVETVTAYYGEIGQPAIACVLPDSDEESGFTRAGWVTQGPDTLFLLAGVAGLRRLLGDRPGFGVDLSDDGGGAGQRAQATATVGDQGSAHATFDGDWLGIRALDVRPERRRRGLGLALLAALVDWGAERGATTSYLQVGTDNAAARSLYDRLGFTTHHVYRYLAPPPAD